MVDIWVPATDTSSGSQWLASSVVEISSGDTGTGIDLEHIQAVSPLGDIASAVESALIDISSSDTASVTEDGSVEELTQPITSSDTATGVDAESLVVSLIGTDTGSSEEDNFVAVSVASSDTALGVEDTSIVVSLSSSDIVTASDTEELLAEIAGSDTASGSDDSSIAVIVSSTDLATSSDESFIVVALFSSETGTAVDSSEIFSPVTDGDLGSGIEQSSVSVPVSDGDTASASEGGSLEEFQDILSSDIASVVEAHSLAAALTTLDTGSSSEGEIVSATVSSSEPVTSADSGAAVEFRAVSSDDTFSSVDSQVILAFVSSADTGLLTDIGIIGTDVTDGDTGSAVESETVSVPIFDTDTGYVVDDGEFGLAVWPDTAFAMPSIVEILRQRSIRVDGVMQIDWHPLNSPENAGWFKARFDLQFVKPGKSTPIPVVSGVQQDRMGVMFADTWVMNLLKAGDRVRCVSGPITGTFDVRNIPDQALGYSKAHHLEVDVVEVSQRPIGTYVETNFYVPSGIRHLYASRVEVLRQLTVSRSAGGSVSQWVKIEDVPDLMLDLPGEMMCRLDLQFLRVGKDQPLPVVAGRAQDRVGTLFCDITSKLRAGDRIRCVAGDIEGTFELKAIPDLSPDLTNIHHIEVQITEVSQNLASVVTS